MSEIGKNPVVLGWAFLCNNDLKLPGGFSWSPSLPWWNYRRIQVTNLAARHVMDVQNVTLYAGSLIKSCLMLTLQGSFKGWKHSELLKKSDNFRHFSFIFVFSHNDSLHHTSKECCHGRNAQYWVMKTIKKQDSLKFTHHSSANPGKTTSFGEESKRSSGSGHLQRTGRKPDSLHRSSCGCLFLALPYLSVRQRCSYCISYSLLLVLLLSILSLLTFQR